MATYTDIDLLRARFYKVLTDEVAPEILTEASVIAYNFINSYLYEIYTVPFSSTPAAIKNISDIMTRRIAQVLALKQPIIFDKEKADEDMKTALQWLFDIATGKAGIPGFTRLTTRGPLHNMADYTPIFNIDDAEYNVPDPDLMDVISDDRDA